MTAAARRNAVLLTAAARHAVLITAAALSTGCIAKGGSTFRSPDDGSSEVGSLRGPAVPADGLPVPAGGGSSPAADAATGAARRGVAPDALGGSAGPPRRALPAPAGPAAPLAVVGGRAITAADLGAEVLSGDAEAALAALERVVERAVVLSEASREGVVPTPAAVLRETDRLVAERLAALRLRFGADGAEVLRVRYGRSVETLRTDCEADARHLVLRDRLVRLSQFREDGVVVRVLVVADSGTAVAAAESLRGGADIALLARRLDAAPPAAPPPLRADEIPDPSLREALLASRAGGVLEPVPFDVADPDVPDGVRRAWQVFRVVRTWRGTAEPWASVAARVEESVAAAPPTDAEVRRWSARAWVRAGVSGTSLPRGQ